MANVSSTVIVIGLLCVSAITAQDNNEEIIDLFKEQVCYFPDYDLVRNATAVQEQQLNTSGYASGTYILTSHPSRCTGLGVLVDSCFEQRIEPGRSDFASRYRLLVHQYRDNSMSQYEIIGSRAAISSNEKKVNFTCDTSPAKWIVEKGDNIAVEINDCDNNYNTCPARGIFDSLQLSTNTTVQYINSRSDTVDQDTLTPLTPALVNVRVQVVPAAPPLPPTCQPTLTAFVCANTTTNTTEAPLESNNFVVGEVDFNPDPTRRFWGGGVYIMPYRIPTSGKAVSMTYTALLNTQGTDNTQFQFSFAQMRETATQFQVIYSKRILITLSVPPTNEFASTVYSATDSIDRDVEEGDLFAVFVPNVCNRGICPAHVNLLNNGDCQSTSLYFPFFGSNDKMILKNDPSQDSSMQLRPAPITVNINISITPTDSNYELPICSTMAATIPTSATPTSATPTSATPTTLPPTFSEEISTYASIVGAVILVLVIIVTALIILMVVIFVILRKQNKPKQSHDIEMKAVVYEEVLSRDIAVTPMVHVEVNEKGRFRRRTMDSDSQLATQRARVYSRVYDYSRVASVRGGNSSLTHSQAPLLEAAASQTNDDNHTYSDIATNKRVVVTDGNLMANYQLAEGEYSTPVVPPANRDEELKRQLAKLGVDEIPEDQLELEEEIGSGQFGTVYHAKWEFSISDTEVQNAGSQVISAHVAVKVMSSTKSQEDRIKFLQEAVLLAQFNDPNIVAVFGVITNNDKLMMICELMDEDLRNHLSDTQTRLKSDEDTAQERSELPALLLSYCRKIASSFVYLGLKGFVHRDLAARNILVSKEGDCKIADFGMSRDLQDDEYYKSHGGLIPVKWTAPEALMYRKYSVKSDVWSYGMLLYEIWSLGHKPYQDLSNSEVIKKVQAGYRQPPPPGCPRAIYDLIIKCTHPQTESRPSFTNILTSLQRPDYKLLQWSVGGVVEGSEDARTLGAPLEEGEALYIELQNKYA